MMCHDYGVARVGAVQAGFFVHLVPVFGVMFAALVLGERLAAYHAVGFVLVAGGAVMSCWKREPVLSSGAREKAGREADGRAPAVIRSSAGEERHG